MGVIWEEEEGHQVLKKKGDRQTDEKELPCGNKTTRSVGKPVLHCICS